MLASLKREERIGLGIAAALHAALVVAFLIQPETRETIEPTQRMTVNLTSEVGLEASAPEPVAESRAAIAPTLADEPAPAPPEAAPEAVPAVPIPRLERPVANARPVPTRPVPARPARAQPRPQPSRAAAPRPPAARPAPVRAAPAPAAQRGGGSRVGDNFLAGMGESTRTSEARAPAAALGASARAALLQGIVRAVKPHWQPPNGPDVDQLISKIRFRLNQDGSLAGRPTLVSQRGETAANRAQASRHGEQAIRAVQLAAPFDLPGQHYAAWKTVTLDFDWKLAQ